MARYELTFVIDTDIEDVATQAWWPLLGEKPMPIEWLEYILVRDLTPDEYVLDVEFEPDTINLVDMTDKGVPAEVVKPTHLSLVVNNDDDDTEHTKVPEKE